MLRLYQILVLLLLVYCPKIFATDEKSGLEIQVSKDRLHLLIENFQGSYTSVRFRQALLAQYETLLNELNRQYFRDVGLSPANRLAHIYLELSGYIYLRNRVRSLLHRQITDGQMKEYLGARLRTVVWKSVRRSIDIQINDRIKNLLSSETIKIYLPKWDRKIKKEVGQVSRQLQQLIEIDDDDLIRNQISEKVWRQIKQRTRISFNRRERDIEWEDYWSQISLRLSDLANTKTDDDFLSRKHEKKKQNDQIFYFVNQFDFSESRSKGQKRFYKDLEPVLYYAYMVCHLAFLQAKHSEFYRSMVATLEDIFSKNYSHQQLVRVIGQVSVPESKSNFVRLKLKTLSALILPENT